MDMISLKSEKFLFPSSHRNFPKVHCFWQRFPSNHNFDNFARIFTWKSHPWRCLLLLAMSRWFLENSSPSGGPPRICPLSAQQLKVWAIVRFHTRFPPLTSYHGGGQSFQQQLAVGSCNYLLSSLSSSPWEIISAPLLQHTKHTHQTENAAIIIHMERTQVPRHPC